MQNDLINQHNIRINCTYCDGGATGKQIHAGSLVVRCRKCNACWDGGSAYSEARMYAKLSGVI